jgi:tetratricopeptide (TPR) repeat protein
MGLGKLNEAEDLLTKAYETTKDLKDNSQLTVFYNLGQLYMKKGNYEKALDFNNQIIGRYTVQEDPSGVLMLKKQLRHLLM